MNWKATIGVVALLCIVVFVSGYYLGRYSVSKQKETVYVDRFIEVPVIDTLLLPSQTVLAPPDTVYLEPDYTGKPLNVSSYTETNDDYTLTVSAYTERDTVEYFEVSLDFEPKIIERTLTVVVTDTVKTEIIIKKPGLRERGTWALIGAGLFGLIVAIGGVF